MKINSNNNISFGQNVSTRFLLRAGSGRFNFEEFKLLNKELGVEHAGHISFHKRALDIAQKASLKDPKLGEIFDDLKNTGVKNLESKIKFYTDKLGEKIDIEV